MPPANHFANESNLERQLGFHPAAGGRRYGELIVSGPVHRDDRVWIEMPGSLVTIAQATLIQQLIPGVHVEMSQEGDARLLRIDLTDVTIKLARILRAILLGKS